MDFQRLLRWLSVLLLLGVSGHALACDTTLNPGANVGTAISAAAGGTTICLNSGNYSGFTLNGVSKAPRVVVEAVTPGGATITSTVTLTGGTNGITLDGVNTSGVTITGATTREITIKNADASEGSIIIDGVTTATPNILFENLTHLEQDNSGFCRGGIYPCVAAGAYWFSYAGRATPVATIRGAYIDGGCADGIQSGVPFILEDSEIRNKVVGACPNDPHTDATQLYGGPFAGTIIRRNYYYANVQVIAAYDGVDGVIIEDNVLDPGPSGERRYCQIELYSDANSIIRRNTVLYRDAQSPGAICLDRKTVDDAGYGTQLYDNIAYAITTSNGSDYAARYNNLLRSGAITANNEIAGAPTYVGGSAPATLDGFRLAAGSLGKNASSTGSDIGTTYFGVADTESPTPPSNFSVATVSATQLALSWTAGTDNIGIAGYDIRRCTGAACTPTVIVAQTAGTGTTYADTGLSASTTYRYDVRARDGAGNVSGYTATASGTTSAPAQLTVTPSEGLNADRGAISPSAPQSVTEGQTTQFTVEPASDYQALVAGTCGGSLSGTTYTTNVIAADCTVVADYLLGVCALQPAGGSTTTTAMTAQTGVFTYRFAVIPAATTHDLTIGHTNGAWTSYTSYATIVRFSSAGLVDVRNGGSYTALTPYPYQAGTQYDIRLTVDVPARTYSVWIAANGGAETELARNYAFRTEQAAVTQLDRLVSVTLAGSTGGAYLCPVGVDAGDTTAPIVLSMGVPAAGNAAVLLFDEAVTVAGQAPTLSASGGAVLLSYASGSGTATLTYSTSRQILGAETVTMSYTQLGDGIEDLADNDLASFSGAAVTNASTQTLVALSGLTPAAGTRLRRTVTATTLGVTTDKAASCRWGPIPGLAWGSLTPYTTTGATTHSSALAVTPGTVYQICARCLDTAANQYSADACAAWDVRPERRLH